VPQFLSWVKRCRVLFVSKKHKAVGRNERRTAQNKKGSHPLLPSVPKTTLRVGQSITPGHLISSEKRKQVVQGSVGEQHRFATAPCYKPSMQQGSPPKRMLYSFYSYPVPGGRPKPYGSYMKGIEHKKFRKGQWVTMVLLQTNQGVPRDQLMLVVDRRAKERPSPSTDGMIGSGGSWYF